jgi:squalene synthase HpnC
VALTHRARPSSSPELEAAYAWCREYSRAHQENFTVVSWVLPKALRPHFFSLYAFCRYTDDLGDEAEGDRLAQLDEWERKLLGCYEGLRKDPIFAALGSTIDRYRIPPEPFLDLIEANRMDQRISRFATYDDLLDYCHRSATPVGRMVLHVLGYREETRQALADQTCIGLQLANFWQDVTVDWRKGRVYLPEEDMARFGVSTADIEHRRDGPAFRSLIRFEVERAQALFDEGRQLEAMVDRRARADVRLFRLGGEATLAAIAAHQYDVLTARPTIPKQKKAWMALSCGVRLKLGI